MMQLLWEQYRGFLKTTIMQLLYPGNRTSASIPKRSKGRDLNMYLHTHVPSSPVHESQMGEATQASTYR